VADAALARFVCLDAVRDQRAHYLANPVIKSRLKDEIFRICDRFWRTAKRRPARTRGANWATKLRLECHAGNILIVINAALAHPVSRRWKGHWQRVSPSLFS
jgi:hypothetical protein